MAQVIGMFLGALVVLVPIAKWLINDYIKKTEKLEKLKQKRIDGLESKIKEVEDSLYAARVVIENHSQKLTHSLGVTERISVKLDMYDKKMDRRERDMEDLVSKEVGQQLRTEILKITDQLVMVKSGKK